MKEVTIQIPPGHEIDLEKSNLEKGKIIFKPTEVCLKGYYIGANSYIGSIARNYSVSVIQPSDRNVFATAKQAEAALAWSQLTQYRRLPIYGPEISDEAWDDPSFIKWCIGRRGNGLVITEFKRIFFPFAFITKEYAQQFLDDYRGLLEQYYMLPVS